MYPHGQLIELAERKAALQRRIQVHRWECADRLGELVRPLRWIDAARERLAHVNPLGGSLALLLAGLLQKRLFPKKRLLGFLLRWGPWLFGLLKTRRA
jgi:hypothetical protein